MSWRWTLSALLIAGAIAAQPSAAKDASSLSSRGGAVLPGSPYRYVAISPGAPPRLTVVERIVRRGGELSRWWHLRGRYRIPAAAYDGSGTALSADGRELVLFREAEPPEYPPRSTRFAVLDTRRSFRWRGPGRPPRTRRFARTFGLRGDFGFYAISPDGSTLYLTHRSEAARGPAYVGNFELRAFDLAAGKLLPDTLGGYSAAGGRAEGSPISRADGRDGRWAFTLHGGFASAPSDDSAGTPFIDALDTVGCRSVRIDLPGLMRMVARNELFQLILRVRRKGRELALLGPRRGGSRRDALVTMDTRNLEEADRGCGTGGFLGFARTPRRPGNVMERVDTIGHSARGRPIRLRQLGDPALPGELLVVGCIHGDECAARHLRPTTYGCPDPHADVYVVPNLDPDGLASGTRLNGRGVDLNRNFPSEWAPVGRRGDPEYAGPKPLSEPETRLAVRIVEKVRPEATLWFHQIRAGGPFVRAWGPSVRRARRFARLAVLPFRRLPWPQGTAPNWQNHRFPGSASFVVELRRGPLARDLQARLERAIVLLGREVGRG